MMEMVAYHTIIRKLSNIHEVVGKNNNEIIKFADSAHKIADLYALKTNQIRGEKS